MRRDPSIGHHAQEIVTLRNNLGPAIALFFDGGMSMCLIYAGYWTRRKPITTSEEWSIATWTTLGGLVGFGIAGMTLIVESIEGRPITEPQFTLLVSTAGGALTLFGAGYYAARHQKANHQYKTLFNNTVQLTGLLKLDGTIDEINDTALEFGGFSRTDVVGKKFDTLSWWTHSKAVRERMHEALEQAAAGKNVRYETEVRGDDGLRVIDFSAKPVTDIDGDISQIIVSGYDITDKHRQQEHLQVLHRVVRHNLRNDLTKINGWTHRAATASPREKRITHADKVESIVDSWEKIVNDLKQAQGIIESKNGQLYYEPTDKLLSGVVASQQSTHPTAEISSTVADSVTGRIPQYVEAAVGEAIDNAVTATTGKIPIVDVTVSDTGEDWITVGIADNGPGMPDAEAAVLETGQETPLRHGSALGVWKIRLATKQAGGDISVDTDDSGTVVHLRIPSRNEQAVSHNGE